MCNHNNTDGYNFCPYCGMPLTENVSTPMKETTYPKIMEHPKPLVPHLGWNGHHNGMNVPTPSSLTPKEVESIQNKVLSYFNRPKKGYQTILSIFGTLTILCDETNAFHKKENFTAAQVTEVLHNSTKMPSKYHCTSQLLLNLHLIELIGNVDYGKIEIQPYEGCSFTKDNIVRLYRFRENWEEIFTVITKTVKEGIAVKENSIITQMNELDYKIKKPFNEIALTFPYL